MAACEEVPPSSQVQLAAGPAQATSAPSSRHLRVPCSLNPNQGSGRVEPITNHLLTNTEVARGGGVCRPLVLRNQHRSGFWDKESTAEPVRFVLNVLVPVAAPVVAERWSWRMQKERVRQLMGEVADLPLARNGTCSGRHGVAQEAPGRLQGPKVSHCSERDESGCCGRRLTESRITAQVWSPQPGRPAEQLARVFGGRALISR